MRTPLQRSPISLIQEEIRDERPEAWQWRVLVVSMMLNLTTGKQVRGVMGQFFDRYPNPYSASGADPAEMAEIVRPLGLYNRRSRSIIRMSDEYCLRDGDASELHGVGKYALDSWTIFVKGEIVEDVEDHKLCDYVRWAVECCRSGQAPARDQVREGGLEG